MWLPLRKCFQKYKINRNIATLSSFRPTTDQLLTTWYFKTTRLLASIETFVCLNNGLACCLLLFDSLYKSSTISINLHALKHVGWKLYHIHVLWLDRTIFHSIESHPIFCGIIKFTKVTSFKVCLFWTWSNALPMNEYFELSLKQYRKTCSISPLVTNLLSNFIKTGN